MAGAVSADSGKEPGSVGEYMTVLPELGMFADACIAAAAW